MNFLILINQVDPNKMNAIYAMAASAENTSLAGHSKPEIGYISQLGLLPVDGPVASATSALALNLLKNSNSAILKGRRAEGSLAEIWYDAANNVCFVMTPDFAVNEYPSADLPSNYVLSDMISAGWNNGVPFVNKGSVSHVGTSLVGFVEISPCSCLLTIPPDNGGVTGQSSVYLSLETNPHPQVRTEEWLALNYMAVKEGLDSGSFALSESDRLAEKEEDLSPLAQEALEASRAFLSTLGDPWQTQHISYLPLMASSSRWGTGLHPVIFQGRATGDAATFKTGTQLWWSFTKRISTGETAPVGVLMDARMYNMDSQQVSGWHGASGNGLCFVEVDNGRVVATALRNFGVTEASSVFSVKSNVMRISTKGFAYYNKIPGTLTLGFADTETSASLDDTSYEIGFESDGVPGLADAGNTTTDVTNAVLLYNTAAIASRSLVANQMMPVLPVLRQQFMESAEWK